MLPLYMLSMFNNLYGSLPLIILSFVTGLKFGTLPVFIFKIFNIHLYKIKDKSYIREGRVNIFFNL